MADLGIEFDKAMFGIYQRAKSETNYNATIFLQMLTDNRGVKTAKTLINAAKPSDGYTALWERNRLDLTVEAVVLADERWHALFTGDELARAQKRLSDYGYSNRVQE